MEEDSARLADRAAGGDAAAVELLLERHLPSLRAFVRIHMGAQLRARESRSDLVQSVCREVLGHLDRFRHPSEGAFKHWLFTTAMRKISNRARDLERQKRDVGREAGVFTETQDAGEPRAFAAGGLGGLEQVYARISSPSGIVARAEEFERVEAALDRLTPEQREVLVLAHVVELSRAEIGERIGKSEVAVRALLYRATARLAVWLDAGG